MSTLRPGTRGCLSTEPKASARPCAGGFPGAPRWARSECWGPHAEHVLQVDTIGQAGRAEHGSRGPGSPLGLGAPSWQPARDRRLRLPGATHGAAGPAHTWCFTPGDPSQASDPQNRETVVLCCFTSHACGHVTAATGDSYSDVCTHENAPRSICPGADGGQKAAGFLCQQAAGPPPAQSNRATLGPPQAARGTPDPPEHPHTLFRFRREQSPFWEFQVRPGPLC